MSRQDQGPKGTRYPPGNRHYSQDPTQSDTVLKIIAYQVIWNIGLLSWVIYPIFRVFLTFQENLKYRVIPLISEIPGNTQEKMRYLEIPGRIFQHFYAKWKTMKDNERQWKTMNYKALTIKKSFNSFYSINTCSKAFCSRALLVKDFVGGHHELLIYCSKRSLI